LSNLYPLPYIHQMTVYIAIVMTILLVSTYYRNKEWEEYIKKSNKEVYEWRAEVLNRLQHIKEYRECLRLLERMNHDDVVYKKWRDDRTYYTKSICDEIDNIINELANQSWEIAPSTTDRLIHKREIIKNNIYPLPWEYDK
jgi:hypothetical protein